MAIRLPYFLAAVLIPAILCLSLPSGFARNVKTAKFEGESIIPPFSEKKASSKIMEFSTMDYDEPGANTNPRAGYFWGSPLPFPPRAADPPPPHPLP